MPIKTVAIKSTPNGSRLFAEDIHTAYHLDMPIAEEDLRNLIVAAAKADDLHPRAELMGVLADRTENGVRVRNVANTSHFDIPWQFIVRGIE